MVNRRGLVRRVCALVALGIMGGAASARAQGAARTAARCGGPFAPSRLVSGRNTTLPGTGVSVTMPVGWSTERATSKDGALMFLLNAPPAGGAVGVLAASDKDGDRPLSELAVEAGNDLSPQEAGRVVVSREFTLNGACGLQVIFQTRTLEGYITLVRSGARVYVVAAKYPLPAFGAMRAGLDTIVASARVSSAAAAPAAPAEAAGVGSEQRFTGCWESAPDRHSANRLLLRPDGSYSWVRAVVGMPMAVEPSEEVGRYRVVGNTMTTSAGSETTSYQLALSGGALTIGRSRYFRCN